MFSEDLNTEKLEFYLDSSTRGFVLLQVNDKRYEEELINLIASMRTIITLNLKEKDFRQGIEYLKTQKEVQVLLYHNFDVCDEELRSILEKINLSRDLLLVQNRIVVFIVPQYVAYIIQDEFPNLYSYFTLKEVYIKKYPLLFEYILPDKKYLVTKDRQSEYKKFFFSSEEGIEERLDYYTQKKVKGRELAQLKEDFSEYLKSFHEEMDDYDWRYYYTLLLRMADVCFVQEDYKSAKELYNKVLTAHIVIEQYQGIYFEACLKKGDILLQQGDFNEAIDIYTNVICMLAKQQDFDNVDIKLEYSVKVYPRTAICYAKIKQYDQANIYMHYARKKAEERKDYQECFAIIYNQILIEMHMENLRVGNTIGDLFEELKGLISCDVQKALYFSLYAWYQGVINGQRTLALQYAYNALTLKREVLVENDVRIAENHYLISILYMLNGDMEHAIECRKKCVNILGNYELEKERIEIILKLI